MDKTTLKKIALGSELIAECKRVLNLSVDESGNIVNNDVVMEWHDMESIILFILSLEKIIDAVLFFGYTMGVYLERDAINWAEFSNDYISMIIEDLKKKQCSKFIIQILFVSLQCKLN